MTQADVDLLRRLRVQRPRGARHHSRGRGAGVLHEGARWAGRPAGRLVPSARPGDQERAHRRPADRGGGHEVRGSSSRPHCCKCRKTKSDGTPLRHTGRILAGAAGRGAAARAGRCRRRAPNGAAVRDVTRRCSWFSPFSSRGLQNHLHLMALLAQVDRVEERVVLATCVVGEEDEQDLATHAPTLTPSLPR